jgi:YYY domain-containing protein
MDFAYLMAVIKSTTFPPYDPWHAGGFLSYYYYGFVIVGTLIKLTGVVPWVAYNLVIPTLFALTGVGAFSVAFNLAAGDRATVFPGEEAPAGGLRIGSTLAGLAGVFFVTIIGNFGNVKLLIDQLAARSKLPPQAGFLGLQKLIRALDGVVAVAGRGQPFQFPNDWWFWNASRVIPDTINEFPFFTFTYADLHAHMIALPLTLLGLAVATALVRISDFRFRAVGLGAGVRNPQSAMGDEPSPWRVAWPEFLPIALLGLVAGALRATNTWDFPTYLLVGLIAMAVLEAARRSQMAQPEALDERLAFLFRAVVAVLWRMVILVAVAVVTFYPFTKYYATAYAGLQLWTDAKSKLPDYITVHGFFLTLAIIYLISEAVSQIRERQVPDWVLYLAPAASAMVIVLIAAGWVLGVSVWLIALPLAATAFVLALGREVPQSRRLGLLLIAMALAITMGVEVVRQRDDIGRMNTVFKFYMQAWVLFGVGTAFGLAGWASRAMTWHRNWRRIAWGVTAALFIGVMLYPAFAARAKIRDRFSAEASPRGIDGIAYMDKAIYVDNNRDMKLAADKDAISWLLHNVQGSPVILEGVTPNYRWGSRFSIYTGLPAVAGWDWHQKQQRSVVPLVVDRRIRHVGEIYNTTDTARARHLLNTYGVSYIIVGELERAYYQAQGLAKFDAWAQQGYLRQVYPASGSNAGGIVVRIYEVTGRGQTVAAAPPRPTRIGPPPVPTPTPGAKPAAPAARSQDSPLPTAQPFASPKK